MTTVITKNSSTASAVPASGSLVQGELAVNVTDKKLYTKDSGGTVVKLVGSLGNQEPSAVAITGGTVAGVAQTGSTINSTPIGGSSASTITGTVITATTGFSGPLTGAVTGNTAGTHTGAVVGDVTGNLTGNVTASSGSSSFNNVTINGTLDMNSGTTGTVTGLATPTLTSDAATKGYVDTSISNLVASAPTTLDTLNEIAAALGNDPNLSTTLTTSIATKLPLAGGTMTGAIAMGTNKVTGLGTPTAGTDATTKTYVDTADALALPKAGGTMSGAIAMGTNKITGLGDPTLAQDATTKTYVDGILGSATSAATSAAAAATSATNAANSATSASTSATSALSYLNAFKGQYYGTSASDPTLDPLGSAIGAGDLYWNTTVPEMRVYNGSAWVSAYLPAASYVAKAGDTMTGNLVVPGITAGGGTALGGATNPIISMAKGANNYIQGYIVNNTNGTSSSADLVAYPSNGADAHGWVDIGITSLAYADTTYTVTGPNESYLFASAPSASSTTGNLVIATDNTGTANAIQFYTNGFTQSKSAWKMQLDSAGNLVLGAGSLQQKKTAVAASAIDMSLGNFFTKTISTTTTFTVSNVPATGTAASFILDLTNGGAGTITWWTGVKWAGGTAPTLTTSGRDVLGFFTHDGGTTWTGLVLGKDVK